MSGGAEAAPALLNHDTPRDHLWWQLQRGICPSRKEESHIPFVTAQLVRLRETAQRRVSSFEGKATAEEMAIYNTHFAKIFSEKTVSFTSLNIKGIQCAILFNMLLKSPIRPRVYAALAALQWDEYPVVLAYITAHTEDENLGCFLVDEVPPCIPSLNNKAIVVLLGVMSLYEIVWSLAQNVYFIGLITDSATADGSLLDPISFLEHDVGHIQDRFLIGDSAAKQQKTLDINLRVNHFLRFIEGKDRSIREACILFLFLYLHHEIRHKEGIFLRPIREGEGFYADASVSHHILLRLSNPDDLGSLLPKGRGDVEVWLREQWGLFVAAWNEFFPSFSAAAALPPVANSAKYMEKTLENATRWGGARRKTRKRKQKRRSVKK